MYLLFCVNIQEQRGWIIFTIWCVCLTFKWNCQAFFQFVVPFEIFTINVGFYLLYILTNSFMGNLVNFSHSHMILVAVLIWISLITHEHFFLCLFDISISSLMEDLYIHLFLKIRLFVYLLSFGNSLHIVDILLRIGQNTWGPKLPQKNLLF